MRLACIKPRQWFLVIEIVGCSHLEALEMGIRAGNEPSRSLNFYNLVEGFLLVEDGYYRFHIL